MDFPVPANPGVTIEENEKRDKYLNFAIELKRLWNMKVTVVPVVISALAPIFKDLVRSWKRPSQLQHW